MRVLVLHTNNIDMVDSRHAEVFLCLAAEELFALPVWSPWRPQSACPDAWGRHASLKLPHVAAQRFVCRRHQACNNSHVMLLEEYMDTPLREYVGVNGTADLWWKLG